MPRKIVTHQLRSYPAAKADIPELTSVKRVFVKASARLSNRSGCAVRLGHPTAQSYCVGVWPRSASGVTSTMPVSVR